MKLKDAMLVWDFPGRPETPERPVKVVPIGADDRRYGFSGLGAFTKFRELSLEDQKKELMELVVKLILDFNLPYETIRQALSVIDELRGCELEARFKMEWPEAMFESASGEVY